LRILIVTWAWPPIGRVGALRPLGMAREWTQLGHEVHVLTGPGDRGGEFSPDLEAEALATGAVVHRAPAPSVPAPRSRVATREEPPIRIARRVSRARQVLAQWRNFPDYQRSWITPAAELGTRIAATHAFDVVWSTSPPESAHFVARRLSRHGLPWVADFRDPWADYALARWDPLSRWVIDRVTRRVLSRSRALTANAEGIGRSLTRATGRPVVCVRNGYVPRAPRAAPVRERVLGYFGRVDPQVQHPERLWPPLRRLRDAGRPWRVEFHLSPGGGGSAAIVPPPDLRPLVSISPSLPHSEALTRMEEFTALLVLPFEAKGGDLVVQAKFYEYVASGRPLLVVAPEGYEARRLVEATGRGLAAWGEAGIARAMENLENRPTESAPCEPLLRSTLARRLLEVFES
jgi:Glycosyl transferase 4-like domain